MHHTNQPDDDYKPLIVDHAQRIGELEARDFTCSLEGAAAIVRSVHDANAESPGHTIAISAPDGTTLAVLRDELVWFTVPINLVAIDIDVDIDDDDNSAEGRHGRTS